MFYGARAIDCSPCGTGTFARLVGQGRLRAGDRFVHESYIGSRFVGCVEELTEVAGAPAIIPSVEGSAIATGLNTIWIDRADQLWSGFSVV